MYHFRDIRVPLHGLASRQAAWMEAQDHRSSFKLEHLITLFNENTGVLDLPELSKGLSDFETIMAYEAADIRKQQ